MQLLHTFLSFKKVVKKLLPAAALFLLQPVYSQQADSISIESIYNTGWNHIHTNPDSAIFFFNEGKKQSEETNFLSGLVMYHSYSAALQITLNQNKKAIDHYNQAIEIAKKNDLNTDLGLLYMKKGILYQFTGEYVKAAEDFLTAASLLKTNEDRKKVIGLYRNIISTLTNLQQQNQSLLNVLPALENNNTNELEIAAILSQKKTNETDFDFPDQTILGEITEGNTYVIFGGAKFLIGVDNTLFSGNDNIVFYGNYRSIRKIPDGTLSKIPDIPREGTILNQPDDSGKVYLVKNGKLHRIENTQVLQFFGGWDALCTVPENGLKQVPDAGDIVTMQNVNTIFNFKKEYEALNDTLKKAVEQNKFLLNEVGKKLKGKNNMLQKRKILLWTSAVGLVALLFIGLLLAGNFRQKQRLHQQSLKNLKEEEKLQQKMAVEKERTRIATDMHDDLGAGLSRIKFLSESIGIKKQQQQPIEEDITKIRGYSHEMIDKLGEIVWALNEKNDSLSDLLSYTRSYAVEYLTQHGINCKVDIQEIIDDLVVSGEFRRNIYLAVKEALHNIVKHARADNAVINIRAGELLSISIKDDGTGFNKTNVRSFSNGISNMQKRMADIKGGFKITCEGGTEINLTAPLKLI